MRRQRGASAAFVFIILLLVMVVLGAMLTLSRGNTAVDEQVQTKRSLDAASAAIEQYVSATGRLPCPAKPDPDVASDGVASPDAPSVNCDYPSTGVLPWRTIGMRHDDAFDAWGWKISYRVYSNTNGSLTQANGASMVNCDTVQALTTRQPVDGNKLCPAAHDTIDSDFIAGKGLQVVDFGTTYDGTKATGGAAYVLVSHGATGLAAYSSSGIRKDMPNSNVEKKNASDTGPFTLQAASDTDTSATDNSHYDDILLYRTVADLAKRANLAARDWPDDILAGVKFDSTTLQTALGRNPGSGDLGVTSIVFPGATVSGFNSGGAQDLTFVSGGTSGLGGAGGSGNNLNSAAGEGIRIDLTQKAQRFAVTLGNFGTNSFFGFPYAEQARVEFFVSPSSSPILSVTVPGCQSDGGLASFTFYAGAGSQFDSVKITSVATTLSFISSSFNIAEFRTCSANGACATTLDTGASPSGNHCTP